MRIIALLATYNEERFVGPCVEHLVGQGVEVYLIDNDSTDRTVEIAERRLGSGVIGIERFPRAGVYSWKPLLERKAALAAELDADWFLHVDADEIRLPPRPGLTLAEALAEVDREGFKAVNFQEFTFVPTREEPDHDHARYQETMRRYYPLLPANQFQVKAWKRGPEPVDLATTAGHEVRFPGVRIYPQAFPMRHYLFLSVRHAVEKFVDRRYDPAEVADGWHRVRAALREEEIALQSEAELRPYTRDERLDASNPLTRHPLFQTATPAEA